MPPLTNKSKQSDMKYPTEEWLQYQLTKNNSMFKIEIIVNKKERWQIIRKKYASFKFLYKLIEML